MDGPLDAGSMKKCIRPLVMEESAWIVTETVMANFAKDACQITSFPQSKTS